MGGGLGGRNGENDHHSKARQQKVPLSPRQVGCWLLQVRLS